ncbi:hypothetical protein [Stenotrophomonas nitritireducens]|uniref:hypothetical protein n=1 Tax=Stenotrophomonas nitritireducens TaxID=83617 RepID=UPI003D9641D1
MHLLHLFHFLRCLPPCLLLVPALAGPVRADDGGARLKEEVARCLPLVYDAPHDALAQADRLLALPALPLASRIDTVSCRSAALHQLGRNEDSRRAIAQLQSLLRTPGLPLEDYDQVRRRAAFLLLRDGRDDEGLQILEAVQERAIADGNIGGQILALGHIALVHAEQLDGACAGSPRAAGPSSATVADETAGRDARNRRIRAVATKESGTRTRRDPCRGRATRLYYGPSAAGLPPAHRHPHGPPYARNRLTPCPFRSAPSAAAACCPAWRWLPRWQAPPMPRSPIPTPA